MGQEEKGRIKKPFLPTKKLRQKGLDNFKES